MKHIVSFLLLPSILLGCGGGEGGGDALSKASSFFTLKVIDGYLEGAVIYADINDDKMITIQDDLRLGVTNANGELKIDDKYKKYNLIAEVVAGQTKDSDSNDYVTESYEMSTPASSDLITPYTHLSLQLNKDMTTLSNELNLDEHVVKGDFVALKNDPAYTEQASKAHAIARVAVAELPNGGTNTSAVDVLAVAKISEPLIDNEINNNGAAALDNLYFNYDENTKQVNANSLTCKDIKKGNITYKCPLTEEQANNAGIKILKSIKSNGIKYAITTQEAAFDYCRNNQFRLPIRSETNEYVSASQAWPRNRGYWTNIVTTVNKDGSPASFYAIDSINGYNIPTILDGGGYISCVDDYNVAPVAPNPGGQDILCRAAFCKAVFNVDFSNPKHVLDSEGGEYFLFDYNEIPSKYIKDVNKHGYASMTWIGNRHFCKSKHMSLAEENKISALVLADIARSTAAWGNDTELWLQTSETAKAAGLGIVFYMDPIATSSAIDKKEIRTALCYKAP